MMIRSILFLCFHVSAVASYLYLQEADEVPIKEFTNDSNRFMDSTSPRVVEFYSPSCPACVEFKPKFIELAIETTDKYPEIEFFAVSCDDHFDTCKEFGIDDFPTLKVFKAGEDSGADITDDEEGYTADKFAELLDVSKESEGDDLKPSRSDREMGAEDEADEADGRKNDDESDKDGDKDENGDADDKSPTAEDPSQQFRRENENNQEDEADEEGGDNNLNENDENATNGDGDWDESMPSERENALEQFRRDNENNESGDATDADGGEDNSGGNEEDEEDQFGTNEPPVNTGLEKPRRGGALHAKYKPMELDRFRGSLLQELRDHDRKQKRRGFLSFLFGGKDKGSLQAAEADVLTKTMRINTPGTEEFIARRKAITERIEKARRRWRNRMSNVGTMTLGALPYHKDVSRRTFFRSYSHLSEEEGLILDVTHSFIIGLRYGLFLKKNQLEPPQLNAFREYLDLLSVSLPSEWRLHKLILNLRQNSARVAQGRSYLSEILDKYPFEEGWSKDCANGRFTCGFWKLLHTSTVGIAENRGGLNLIESGLIQKSARTFSPSGAAFAIRNYIDHFFTCGPCRTEFIANFDACDNNRRCDRLTAEVERASVADWKELATWLWEVHNEVSVRVAKTRAAKMNTGLPTRGNEELPATEQLKALWPQIKHCIACFKEDGSWNEAGIFTYLESKYW